MEANILKAIIHLIENPIIDLRAHYEKRNRSNSMGASLEEYIKDVIAGTLKEMDDQKRLQVFESVFSYLGNQNNPPDMMIRGGDAIEVKKIESKTSDLALNSSYPKAKLLSNSNMITEACRSCESWKEKDILYAVGVVPKENGKEGRSLRRLCFIYGIDYAASASVYERIKNVIMDGINSIENVGFSETNELGRVNQVDPLGITSLRIRGMWGIKNPTKVFEYIHNSSEDHPFEFMAVINSEKYSSFPEEDRKKIETIANQKNNIKIKTVKIKTSDNQSVLKDAKLITFSL